jgi:hypothetical protein
MNTYEIEMEVKVWGEFTPENKIQRWSGYTEQVAIAQAFLSEAQQGAREIKIINIKEVK